MSRFIDEHNVARGGTTAMAATALGISVFDLLFRGGGIGGRGGEFLGGGIGGHGNAGARHEGERVAYLDAEVRASKEITALQIALAKKDGEIGDIKLDSRINETDGRMRGLEAQVKQLQNMFVLAPALADATELI
jgi:hypothetical protein